MKEHTLDILTAALIKYGTRVFWAAVIVFVGLRIIRIARKAAGQIMDRAGVEVTLKKFLDMLLHAVLFGVMVFMAADQLGISQSRLNQYLKNRREPDSQMLCKICETFGITPNYLFGYDENAPAGLKISKAALESAILFLKKYETAHQKNFSAEQSARIISVVYDIVLSESAENAQKAIDWVIEAVA